MWDLVADIGGTNMRFAAVSRDGIRLGQRSFPTCGDQDVYGACKIMIADQGTDPAQVAIAAAGVVNNGDVRLTNSSQQISEAKLRSVTNADKIKILNDFEAAAWSLATTNDTDLNVLQGQLRHTQAPRLIIGPGTGLGVGAMVWTNGAPYVVSGEGGHVTLAPQTAEEVPYFEALVSLWPEVRIGNTLAVEAEAILSGTGIPMFYKAVAVAQNLPHPLDKAEDIFAAAKSGEDALSHAVVTLFRRYLGTVAGDLALVFDARGGVFITGGVALSNAWVFDAAFLEAFNAGGRHSQWRKKMPVSLYQNSDFGLIGARNYLTNA